MEWDDDLFLRMLMDQNAVIVSHVYTDAEFPSRRLGNRGVEYHWHDHRARLLEGLAERQVAVQRNMAAHANGMSREEWCGLLDEEASVAVREACETDGSQILILCVNTKTPGLVIGSPGLLPGGSPARPMDDHSCVAISPPLSRHAPGQYGAGGVLDLIGVKLEAMFEPLGHAEHKAPRLKHRFTWKMHNGEWLVAGARGFEGKTVPVQKRGGDMVDVHLAAVACNTNGVTLYVSQGEPYATERQRSYLRGMLAQIVRADPPMDDRMRAAIEKAKMVVGSPSLRMSVAADLIDKIKPFLRRAGTGSRRWTLTVRGRRPGATGISGPGMPGRSGVHARERQTPNGARAPGHV